MTRLVAAVTAVGLLLASGLAAATVEAEVGDPRGAWESYLARDTAIQPDYRFPFATCFRAAALSNGLPETLLLAVARGESNFDATARSRANAHGVMQIQWPETAHHLGIYRLSDLYDPCTNIDAGSRYLKELLARYDGDLHLSLAAYNYGPSRIPIGAATIPSGATWYSAYIYRHLDFVLGDRRNEPATPSRYSDVGHTVLLSFGEPYRAAAFDDRIETRAPELRIDWFRTGVGKFDVVLSYDDKEEFATSADTLTRAGFPIH